jgi:type IV pilus assembly protein PilW
MYPSNRTWSLGFSVVELLVALALSLILLAGVMTLFANSRGAYETNERLARIQENGRFGLEQIVRDIRASGYPGCAKRTATKPLVNALSSSTSLLWNFSVPVQGFEGASGTWSPALTAPVITDNLDSDGTGADVDGPTPNTDVLVVRRIEPEVSPQRVKTSSTSGTADIEVWSPPNSIEAGDVVIAAGCEGASIFQVTQYTADAAAQKATIVHATGGSFTPGNSTNDVGNLFSQSTAELFPIQTVVFFVDTSTAGNGTSLFRRIGNANPEELAEGVDSLQLQFGVDTNGDSNHLADDYVKASAVTNWDRVVAVRVALLVRSIDEYGSEVDSTSRTLLGSTIPAFNDRRERRVFTTTATLRNKLF